MNKQEEALVAQAVREADDVVAGAEADCILKTPAGRLIAEESFAEGVDWATPRVWNHAIEKAAEKLEQIRDEVHRGRVGERGRWKAGSSGAEWRRHNIMAAAIS